MNKLLLIIFILSSSTSAFSAGCGGLYTSSLSIQSGACTRELEQSKGKLARNGNCASLLDEAERVNNHLDSHNIQSSKSCTPDMLQRMRSDIASAAGVLNKARQRGWR